MTRLSVRPRSKTEHRLLLALARRYGGTALLAMGVLLMFFCPLPQGSFQATHGPASALRAHRAALATLLAIAAVIGVPFSIILASLFLLLFLASLLQDDSGELLPAEDPVGITCELRC